jgi:hypothetical protein
MARHSIALLFFWISSDNRWSGIGVWNLLIAACVHRDCINTVFFLLPHHTQGLRTKKNCINDYVEQRCNESVTDTKKPTLNATGSG